MPDLHYRQREKNVYTHQHDAGHHLPNQPPLVRGGPGAKRRGRGRTIVQVENELNGHLLSGRCPSGRIGSSGSSRNRLKPKAGGLSPGECTKRYFANQASLWETGTNGLKRMKNPS
jgi:hypothetical protein